MPRRLPSSALDQQTQITASSTGAILAGNWYIGTGGAGSGGAVAGTLTGPLVGNADTATAWKNKVVVNGTDLIGNVTPITIGVNTTSNPAAGTYYPLFVPSSSAGNQQASTSAASGFTFDPSTKNLVVAGTLSGSNLSGTNTGDETTATIKTKLDITTLSGSNTGDQDLSGYAPKASPVLTGTVRTQDISIDRTGSDSYKLILNSNVAELQNYLTGYTLKWDYYRIIMAGDITLVRNFVRTPMSLASSGDLTIAGKYYGDGSQLTNLPVTSVNGQTGAVTVSAGVTSVNTLTGAVVVASLYDGVSYSYRSTQNFYKSVTIEGTYLGDYFSGTGLSATGMTVRGFTSQLVGGGCCQGFGWNVVFYLDFTQAFCDAYFPGYTLREIRHVSIKQTGYGVAWVGQAQSATWTITSGLVSFKQTVGTTAWSQTASGICTFNTDNVVFVNGRYSPTAWSSTLQISVYFAY